MSLSPELALHHEELDRQHADLFRLLEAGGAALEGGSTAAVGLAVAAFTDAMLEHVAAEEALMEESLYPERGRHRVAHEVFLTDLQQLQAELRLAGVNSLVREWVRVRAPEWLRFHIAVNDAPLGHHLARRPAAAQARRRVGARRTS